MEEDARMSQLENKVCVITGGAGSIGLASARLLLDHGAKVLLVDLHEQPLTAAAQQLASERVDFIAADVSDEDATRLYCERAIGRFGKIDVLFSNAGNSGVIAPLVEYPVDVFDSVYAVHVRGSLLAAKYGLPRMNDGGSIIIMSSVAAWRSDAGAYAYITAKQAQVGLMRCLASEAAPRRIRVNALHPGPVENEFQLGLERDMGAQLNVDVTAMLNQQIPLGRHASPDEIARSVLFLASDQSSFMTGASLRVDGGLSL
jgi:NAD(P)-dependent dehydrogenase (short-subunit alcohol dehydrogenase family)